MRAREFYPKAVIFSNDISPNDIEQGGLVFVKNLPVMQKITPIYDQ